MALDPVIEKKLLQFKALVGDEAAKKTLEEIEARELKAKAAGVEVKEGEGEEDTPLSLSDLIAEIEAGVEAGTIVDDVTPDEDEPDEEGEPEPAEAKEVKAKGFISFKKKGAKAAPKGQMPMKGAMPMQKEVEVDEMTALKELDTYIDQRIKAALTEFSTKFVPRSAEAEAQAAIAAKALAEAQALVKQKQDYLDELLGTQPRKIVQQFRASQAEATKLKEDDPKIKALPQADPLDEFMTSLGMKA